MSLLALAAVLVVGLQLGAMPWRYRKQFWQLQGALVGLVAGYVLGRFNKIGNTKDTAPNHPPP